MKTNILSAAITLVLVFPATLVAETTSTDDLCSTGKNQSPVNIDSKKALYAPNRVQRALKFNYGLIQPDKMTNTGHGLRIDIDHQAKGAKTTGINIDGIDFTLSHLDIHMPSENTVNDKHFPMEIQFIHKSNAPANQQSYAIVSWMYIPGKEDRTLRKLLKQMPQKAGESVKLAGNTLRSFEQRKKVANYYRYNGSLTSTPCNEGVRWLIMKEPLTLSNQQQQALKAAIGNDNNRSIQNLNARMVME